MVSEGCWGRYFFPLGERCKGNRYVGELKGRTPNGVVTLLFSTTYQLKGSKYVGEFKVSSFFGLGAYYLGANHQFSGEKYLGEFTDDHFHIRGIRYGPNGNIRESGFYKNNPLARPE